MLEKIIIPKKITVHLGRPSSSAENVSVDFIYYIKNVCSSEVYPTWPYEALRANIWCQISLALNRVYTEWYRARGYNFDITNSTAFDQAFVKGRNIYENMALIVDEVFEQFLQKPFYREPFYSEYCDGKRAQCPGLKQWGTLDLAKRGYNSNKIIQYYYGSTIQFKQSKNRQTITSSYPGTPLRFGSEGNDVFIIQELLNGIAVNYPNINLIYPPNAYFGQSTTSAVKTFQKQFNLSVDGIVGGATWNELSKIYVAVRKLAELSSIGRLEGYFTGLWTGKLLRYGDKGIEVQQAQYFLSIISTQYNSIPNVSIDSRFGPGLKRSVIAFQNEFGLLPDGLIGQLTWNEIFEVYSSI
ncbi:MAG: peptidoglycan-binding protein [Longicatena sp.]